MSISGTNHLLFTVYHRSRHWKHCEHSNKQAIIIMRISLLIVSVSTAAKKLSALSPAALRKTIFLTKTQRSRKYKSRRFRGDKVEYRGNKEKQLGGKIKRRQQIYKVSTRAIDWEIKSEGEERKLADSLPPLSPRLCWLRL